MEDFKNGAKYQKLVEDIKRDISTGVYSPGDKLTSENKLTQKYGYSRQTVRQALGLLENQGVLVRKRGSGTFIAQTGYSFKKSFNVGIIATYISDYIFPLIINGIEQVLTPNGYQITLGVTRNRIEEEKRLLQAFAEKKIDGLIVEGTKSAFPNPNIELYRNLMKMGIPVVFFNGYYSDMESCIFVVTDDRQAGYDLTSHMISCGCKRLGGVFKSDDMQGHKRYSGFVSALMNKELPLFEDSIMWYTTADEERFSKKDFQEFMLKRFKSCDGVVCYNDKIAAALLNIFLSNELSVPRDINLGSFDNSRISEYTAVKLTSMNHPKEELGRAAAQKLLKLMGGDLEQSSVKMPMELVVKESTKKFKGEMYENY